MPELSIPVEHHNKFKFYIQLPSELKQKICEQLSIAPIGLSPSALVDFASNNIENLSKERIGDIYQIYFNLIRAKESINVEMDEFLEILSNSLNQTGVEELQPTTQVIEDFKKMLLSSGNTLITAKIIDLMTENQKTFVNARIYQDIRPAFDDNENLLGSVVIHNLKILFKEDDNIKELYISLDDNDLEKVISLFKKAQERLKLIKAQFETAKLIEIK